MTMGKMSINYQRKTLFLLFLVVAANNYTAPVVRVSVFTSQLVMYMSGIETDWRRRCIRRSTALPALTRMMSRIDVTVME